MLLQAQAVLDNLANPLRPEIALKLLGELQCNLASWVLDKKHKELKRFELAEEAGEFLLSELRSAAAIEVASPWAGAIVKPSTAAPAGPSAAPAPQLLAFVSLKTELLLIPSDMQSKVAGV